MPFMKPGQPWLFDDITGAIVGSKDPSGVERTFNLQTRRKMELQWTSLVTQPVLTADIGTNLISLLKTIVPTPSKGSISLFFNPTSNKLNVFNENSSVFVKLNLIGTWSGGGTSSSMEWDFAGTTGNTVNAQRATAAGFDVISMSTFLSVDANDFIAANGTAMTLKAVGRTFTINSVLLIAEQMTSLSNISVR